MSEIGGRVVASKLFLTGAAIGWAVMAFGVLNLLQNSSRTHPDRWTVWFLGVLLVHDLFIAPAVFALGMVIARFVRAPWRRPLQQGLIGSAVVVLVAFPFVGGFGRMPDDPSALPNNYARGLAVTLALVWASSAVVLLLARRRAR
ncbi:hypothetical protein BH24ACT26_BH24ACT26_09830 [soil metagenome]